MTQLTSLMNLRYQQQDCSLTLREGVEEYRAYLSVIGRKAMTDKEGTRLILEHDVSHVIFGMDTSLEQEAGLDTWVLLGCQFRWRYIRRYSNLPEIRALYRSLVADCGWSLFPRLYWKCLGMQWRIFRRTRKMKSKWPFQFPEAWLDQPVAMLREEHGVSILTPEERETGEVVQWNGRY
jgi:hypothetical protein